MGRQQVGVVFLLIAASGAPVVGAQRGATAARGAVAVARVQRTIPYVIGRRADSAAVKVRQMDVGIVYVASPTNAMAKDHVVAQSPRAGTPIAGNVVETLYVATTPPAPPRTKVPVDTDLGGRVLPPRGANSVPVQIPVPSLFGWELDAADTLLRQKHLRILAIPELTEVVSQGYVFQQRPIANTPVDTGTVVMVWYSRGGHTVPATMRMPSVIGHHVDDDAKPILVKADLRLVGVETTRARGANGTIDHQRPEPNSPVHAGEPVSLHVTVAPALRPVPPVIGMHTGDARANLEKNGFVLGSVTRVSRGGSDSEIVTQNPGPGAPTELGTPVNVDENTPESPRRVVVPRLHGLKLEAAESVLARDSLQLGQIGYTGDEINSRVSAQRPEAGVPVPVRQRVDLTLSPPNAPPAHETLVEVPNVTGISYEKARDSLTTVGFVAVARADTVAGRFVVSQLPSGGVFKPRNSRVILTLRVVLVTVPDVTGSTQQAAREQLQFDSLRMSVGPPRRVLWPFVQRVDSQAPKAGDRVAPESVVTVDMTTPIVPPVPASIAVALAGVLLILRNRIWGDRGGETTPPQPPQHWRPITDLGFDVKPGAPSPPILRAGTPENLAKVVVKFEVETPAYTWRVTPNDRSLIER